MATMATGAILILFGERDIGIIVLSSAGVTGATALMTFQKSKRKDS
jgi:hypothetical protein